MKNSGEERMQSGDNPGHQKTPSFACKILYHRVLMQLKELPLNQGGTTDVGLHTGCILRNTSFPLVLSVFCIMLRLTGESPDEVFNRCASAYLVGFLEPVTKPIKAYSAKEVDRAFTVICTVTPYISLVREERFQEIVITEMKVHFDHLKSLEFNAPCPLETETMSELCNHLKSPPFPTIANMKATEDSQAKLDEAKRDAQSNLAWSSLSSDSFSGGLQDAWVQLYRHNQFFWDIATLLNTEESAHSISSLRNRLDRLLKEIDVAEEASQQNPLVMTVVLKSYGLLATWIVFCFSHRETEIKHPLFQNFGSALNVDDLRHIVLDDQRALSAVKDVRIFLLSRERRPMKPFRIMKDTLQLALTVGSSLKSMTSLYNDGSEASKSEMASRWQEIRRKQLELEKLDPMLSIAKSKLHAAERHLVDQQEHCHYNNHGHILPTSGYTGALATRDRCSAEVLSLKSQIKTFEQRPGDTWFGLPEEENTVLKWIFFLYMPQEFKELSELAHLGQSLLWKQPPEGASAVQNLQEWFQSNMRSNHARPSTGTAQSPIQLWSHSKKPNVGTPEIRSYKYRTGVFFPDSLTLCPLWTKTDPFAQRVEKESVILYTEKLPDGNATLQNFMAMLPTPSRENEGVSSMDEKPNRLSPEQFVAFSSLRAHPLSQIRSLVEVVSDNLLPFDHECVHILVKQLLYHIGDEAWKTDLNESWDGLSLIASIMSKQLELLRESPNNSDKLGILGIVCSFFGQTSKKCMDLALEFARSAQRLADEVQAEVEHTADVKLDVYRKQGRLYGYALLCHSVSFREDDVLAEIVELNILFRNKVLFETALSSTSDFKALDQAVLPVLASRMEAIALLVNRSCEGSSKVTNASLLTKCVSLVVPQVPGNLFWKPVKYLGADDTGCFESESANCLYSINILNGSVLVNGVPPGLLPHSIVTDNLFKRTFGERNFEVVVQGRRHYRTTRPVEGRFYYDFIVDSEDCLHISEEEISKDGSRRCHLQLLRKEAFEKLPLRLKEMHSHWYSCSHAVIVLRKPFYRDCEAEYIISREAMYTLPFKSRKSALSVIVNLLPDYNRLLMGKTKLLAMLARFEDPKYIHLTVDPGSSRLRYYLPRFRLEFEQSDAGVSCLQFEGFSVAKEQHLDDTLPGLSQAIVLCHDDGQRKLLIPDGCVGGKAMIKAGTQWDANVAYHIYDEHHRFKNLIAVDTTGRLHLASLYASNASSLIDRRMGKPGYDVAIDLVRQCWKNEPLTKREREKLIEVSTHSHLSATLRLMCWWNWDSSRSVEFLYSSEEVLSDNEKCSVRKYLERDEVAIGEYIGNETTPRLRPAEEFSLLGSQQPHQNPVVLVQTLLSSVQSYINDMEIVLHSWVELSSNDEKYGRGEFPLQEPPGLVGVEHRGFADLKESFSLFCRLPRTSITSTEGRESHLLDILRETEEKRKRMESLLSAATVGTRSHQIEHQLSRFTGKTRPLTILDIIGTLVNHTLIDSINPHLRYEERVNFLMRATDWTLLCVLEDKLHRILSSCKSNVSADGAEKSNAFARIVDELLCARKWDPVKHPRWLVFEVEQQIQIRPYQYDIVDQLLQNDGASVGTLLQLNMGMGKTRVLVPMLLLELASNEYLTRLNVLPSIIHEAIDFYRRVLVASIQHVKLFVLPFHRDLPLEEQNVHGLSKELELCREQLGFLVVSPQHRNSLLLKQHDQGGLIQGLQPLSRDILDESDAILHHDFQLVYALGDQIPLPHGPMRWVVFETFIKILARGECKMASNIISRPAMAHKERTVHGSFPGLRLLEPFFSASYENEGEVGRALCQHLVDIPPEEFQWINRIHDQDDKDLLVRIMSNSKEANCLEKILNVELFQKHRGDILAVRGCIAYGLLFHGLSLRYRVNYGLNPRNKKTLPSPTTRVILQRSEQNSVIQIWPYCTPYSHIFMRGFRRHNSARLCNLSSGGGHQHRRNCTKYGSRVLGPSFQKACLNSMTF